VDTKNVRKCKKASKPLNKVDKKAGWQPLFASIRACAFNHGVINDTNGHQLEPSSFLLACCDPLIEVPLPQEAPTATAVARLQATASLPALLAAEMFLNLRQQIPKTITGACPHRAGCCSGSTLDLHSDTGCLD
jgi:hypothetical protein